MEEAYSYFVQGLTLAQSLNAKAFEAQCALSLGRYFAQRETNHLHNPVD
ncbi:MAG: hypothetical protein SNJ66_06070 [Chloroherpetonaceae bacterium]